MTKHYKEWEPEPYDPAADELSVQVGAREDERLLADPEIDAPPRIEHVGNTPPQPVTVELDRSPHDPNPPHIERVEQRSHLERQPEPTNRFAGSSQAVVTPIGGEDR
jgi:hypothetical protein